MSYPNPQAEPQGPLPKYYEQLPTPQPTRPNPARKPEPKKKPDVAKVILISLGILTAVIIVALALNNAETGSAPAVIPQPSSVVTTSETFEPAEDAVTEDPTVAEPTEAPEPTLTRAQTEAVEAAESYLDFGAFSKRGLIDQLTSEYGEGFAKKDALFAVDYVHANWKAEAVEAAESYLDSGHFSKSELLNQLESPYGEDFTHDQAVYAVNKVY